MLLAFALTLFVSATLLFLVEPMVGKMILPLLGGTPAVWNTCMVFFQAVLLAGYAYAHATTAWLGPRKQAALHLAVLAVPFFFFPLAVRESLLESGVDNPVFPLLLVLTICVGVPMFVVCTSAPLLQKWFADTNHPSAHDPYFLYGASNLGSMLALLGYPVLVEPLLRLRDQSLWWTAGYAVLAILTAVCAVCMWRAPAPALAGTAPKTPAPASDQVQTSPRSDKRKGKGKHGGSPGGGGQRRAGADAGQPGRALAVAPGLEQAPAASPYQVAIAPAPLPTAVPTLGRAVTTGRRIRWVLLAAVPSSLMLGVTTYITTDIAAIPLLWVLPLALYLLSFILVFAHIPGRVQAAFLAAAACALSIGFGVYLGNLAEARGLPLLDTAKYAAWLVALACWLIVLLKGDNLLHSTMILLLPLMVLLLSFLMLAGIKPPSQMPIWLSIVLHLTLLFVVSMVCHGELARDRPDTSHLTEFFLWMSVGGVLGGMFNALVAPLAFNAIVEYPLALVGASLLLPPLAEPKDSSWGRRADALLALLLTAVGGVLLALRIEDHDLKYNLLAREPWGWQLAAVLSAVAVAVLVALRTRASRADAWLDLALPAALLVLVVGLSWGLTSNAIWPRIVRVAEKIHLRPLKIRDILALGLPAVLCYTFVERSLRFGLGVGAVLLGSAFCAGVEEGLIFQKRSFFGVLRVESSEEKFEGITFPIRQLVHGTTLHGMQVLDEVWREVPMTYYHISGPVGQAFTLYNTDPERPYAVIGLGTGTMACYAKPGQHVTFYDIDPVVRDISFKEGDPYFTYVEDARKRGANMELILGDARMTMKRLELAPNEKYRLLVIDAFSSDAIPIHLITREALKVYLDHVAEDGIICFHISNRYLDLKPVLANLAEKEGLAGVFENDNKTRDYLGKSASTWVMLARKPEYLKKLTDSVQFNGEQKLLKEALQPLSCWPDAGAGVAAVGFALCGMVEELEAPWKDLAPEVAQDVGEWTDDYSNLLSVFNREERKR
jgi:hypothetical protein